MKLFKKQPQKKQKTNHIVTTEGRVVTETVYTYMLYDKNENHLFGIVTLPEETARLLNKAFKMKSVDNSISLIRS